MIKALGTYDITTIRASMGMYLLCQAIHETTDVRVLLTGEISDELFGYKYTDFAPPRRNPEGIRKAGQRTAYVRRPAGGPLYQRPLHGSPGAFWRSGLCLLRYGIDPARKMNTYHKGKYLLRHAFEADGLLPRSILMREKAAFSDAVGHSMVDDLKEYAESCYTDEVFKEKAARYRYAAPFTKESLLYRELLIPFIPDRRPWSKTSGCQIRNGRAAM